MPCCQKIISSVHDDEMQKDLVPLKIKTKFLDRRREFKNTYFFLASRILLNSIRIKGTTIILIMNVRVSPCLKSEKYPQTMDKMSPKISGGSIDFKNILSLSIHYRLFCLNLVPIMKNSPFYISTPL